MMVLAGALAFYLGWAGSVREGSWEPGSAPGPTARAPGPAAQVPAAEPEPPLEPPQATPVPVPPPEAAAGALVSVVIDDCGQDLERERGFLELEGPLTLAVLPYLPDSRRVAEEASRRGLCLLLHLPMQASGTRWPGPGALLLDMGDDQLARAAREDFQAVPGIAGFNNHEGSVGSADPRLVGAALSEACSRGLFVLDSRTTAATLLASQAAQRGLPVLSRDVFLDNEDDPERILAQLDHLGDLALRRGHAVALGHPRPATLEALKRGLPQLRARGVRVVPLEELAQGARPSSEIQQGLEQKQSRDGAT